MTRATAVELRGRPVAEDAFRRELVAVLARRTLANAYHRAKEVEA